MQKPLSKWLSWQNVKARSPLLLCLFHSHSSMEEGICPKPYSEILRNIFSSHMKSLQCSEKTQFKKKVLFIFSHSFNNNDSTHMTNYYMYWLLVHSYSLRSFRGWRCFSKITDYINPFLLMFLSENSDIIRLALKLIILRIFFKSPADSYQFTKLNSDTQNIHTQKIHSSYCNFTLI